MHICDHHIKVYYNIGKIKLVKIEIEIYRGDRNGPVPLPIPIPLTLILMLIHTLTYTLDHTLTHTLTHILTHTLIPRP